MQASFVIVALFAAGLVSAGVVSGAGPLAVLSTAMDTSSSDSTSSESTTATTTSDSTTTESTTTESTTTETTESTTTETSPLPTGPPTIASDKNDYAPGETVTLTGDHWVPAEVVHIVVNDDQQKPWSYQADVTASTSGTIYHQFQLPTTFAATYTATATGPISGSATTTFTDGNVKWQTSTPADVIENLYIAATDCTGAVKSGYPQTKKSSDTVGVGNNESLRLDAEAVADNGQLFVAWSSSFPFTVIAGTGGRSICIPGFQSGSRDDYRATYAANTAPTANNVSDSTNEDTPKTITLSASDAEQCELTFSIVTGPSNGTLGSISNVACASGSPNTDTATVPYTPNANYNGSDSFTYRVNDGSANSATATVSLTVNPVNDAPSFTKGADQTVDEDAGAQSVSGWATAISAGPANESGQTITFIVTANSNPSLFSAAPAVSSSGTLTYTPAANAFGSATITLKAKDNGGTANGGVDESATQSFEISVTEVNDPPVAVNDSASVAEDESPGVLIDVLANDSTGPANESGQTLAIDSITVAPAHGTAAIEAGKIRYTPEPDYFGSDSFTYKACDNGTTNGVADPKCDTAAVNVTVTEVNDPPVAANDAASVAEDSATGVLVDVRANDSKGPANESGQMLTIDSLTSAPAHGSAVVVSGQIRYTPTEADYFGPDSFTYKVCDNGTTNGVADPKCDTATVNVTVTSVNDPPTAHSDSASVAEDSATGVLVDVKFNDSAGPANESGQTLTITGVTQGAHGSVAIESGRVRYIPTDADYFGPDTFTYTIQDNGQSGDPLVNDFKSDSGTVNVTVTEVNDKPVAGNDTASVAEDSATGVLVDVRANDSKGPANESGQTLTLDSITQAPAHGTAVIESGQIRYTPTENNYNGPDSFKYNVCDNGTTNGAPDPKCDEATVNVTVTPVNDAPVVIAGANKSGNENDTVNASATFTDVDGGDTHTCSINWGDGSAASSGVVTEPSGPSPGMCSGSHKYLDDNPTATPMDDYTVTMTVTDNGTTNGSGDAKSGSATLKVTIANVPPVITGMSGPSGPVTLGANASVTTNFTDVGSLDTHSCIYSWDDGSPDTTVTAPGTGNGSCTATHMYGAASVYTVGVTVKDDDTGSTSSKYEFVVVFDPNGGFVTGGGWIDSPAGAYRPDPTLTGKANFGFVSKYKKGASVPEGETEFQFHAGNLNFHSDSYQWLVVAGNKAQFKGTGSINGTGGYSFLLTAYDGSPDKFRIKITGPSDVVYDNKLGGSDDIDNADPQAISGGSIVVHKS